MEHVTFSDHCLKAAQRFLRTAVVIDNDAFLSKLHDSSEADDGRPKTAKRAAVGPLSETRAVDSSEPRSENRENEESEKIGAGVMSRNEKEAGTDSDVAVEGGDEELVPAAEPETDKTSADGAADSSKEERRSHPIRTRELIHAFTDRRIICAVYEPRSGRPGVEEIVPDILHSDLLIIDWYLDSEDHTSHLSRRLIGEILRRDRASGGGMRHIAVYTGEPNLPDLAEKLSDHLRHEQDWPVGEDLRQEQMSDGRPVLLGQNLRILFVQKAETTDGLAVSVQDLPEHLIRDFAQLTNGVLPTLALHAIAGIREAAHHTLALFNNRLDGAFITHRLLIPAPEDAEDYIEGVFGDHFRSLLSRDELGSQHANGDVLRSWIESRTDGIGHFANEAGYRFPVDRATMLLCDRLEDDGAVGKFVTESIEKPGKKSNDIGKKRLHEFFYDSATEAENAMLDFSRITSLDYSDGKILPVREKWRPNLTLGVIIEVETTDSKNSGRNEEFLLCVQPRCDSVRLKRARAFPFLRVESKQTGKGNLVVSINGKNVLCFVEPKPMNLTVLEFPPTGNLGCVEFEKSADGKYQINDVSGKEYRWVATLSPVKAQHIAGELGARTHGVGMDEFEWLRIRG